MPLQSDQRRHGVRVRLFLLAVPGRFGQTEIGDRVVAGQSLSDQFQTLSAKFFRRDICADCHFTDSAKVGLFFIDQGRPEIEEDPFDRVEHKLFSCCRCAYGCEGPRIRPKSKGRKNAASAASANGDLLRQRIHECKDLFAHLIAFEVVNIMPAIIGNQLCAHDFRKLLLILNPVFFLVLAVG